ncbi:hypothetical protein [Enterococcus wangshanyuanii]|uniref:Uncharacterized protein n=1 Tax=Enterococcus wangshanyuanii TaxID=2005703 RepID=A0ABQ1PTC5_9ENTE|nr:hypothetical protein [Enterococcus wangshanyuanii]GGD03228.1 hypothetical protein GCM10011573_35870 [Enterococcus wangshanyuanii]
MNVEQSDNENYILLNPRNTQQVVSEPVFGKEIKNEEQGQIFGVPIAILIVSSVIVFFLLTLLKPVGKRKKQKVLTLINCSTDRILVYEEHIFSKAIDIFAYGSTGSIREHWRFPLRYKKCIKRITQENNCKLISSEEYCKTNYRTETVGDSNMTQGEVFSIYLTSGESFDHNMDEVQTDREYIKNVIMTFQVDHFTIVDADGISSYKTCNVEAMTMEGV